MNERGWGVDISEGERDGAHIPVIITLHCHVLVQDIAMSAGGKGVSTGIMLSSHCCCAISEGKEEGARARAYNEHHSLLSMRVEGGYVRGEGEPEE